jgi:hypothetical protein
MTTVSKNCRLSRRNCLGSVQARSAFPGRLRESVCDLSSSGYTDNHNVVEVDFVDGTSLSVELFPMVELKAELNDWNVESGKVLKRWPRMIAR